MQLDLPFLRASVEPTAPEVPLDDPPPLPPTVYVRVRRARRYILRVRPDGTLRVTIPRGGSRAEAARFAAQHNRWVERERRRVHTAHAPQRWTDGTPILLRGETVQLRVSRGPHGLQASYGDRTIRMPEPPPLDLRPLIERDLRALARQELPGRLRELAALHGLTVERVAIRNQRSRWGSCSRRGGIALNLRLVQMPEDVRDYVLVHELMHLKQQNHSVRFWRLVERAYPAFREAERWLKREGRALF